MTKRILALLGAMALLLTFFTACGNNGGTPTGGQNQKNDPQLVIAANPVFVFDRDASTVAYNEFNQLMASDSQSSSLTAIGASAWKWAYNEDGAWQDRAVYGFGRWTSGAGAKAKGAFAYAFNEAGSISLGVYDANKNELVTYQDKAVPDYGVLLSAVAGEEEALLYTVPQDGVLTIPEGTLTAVEQVAGVKTGFLAEDGTARSASVRIMVNNQQLFSGTLKNSTAAEDGQAVAQLSYPTIDNLHVKAGDLILICLKLEAQANSDEDVTAPTLDESKNWQIVQASRTVEKPKKDLNDSDITTDDGSIPTILDYQFTFTIQRDAKYADTVNNLVTTIEKRTMAEVSVDRSGTKNDKYEMIIGVYDKRPESQKIYQEIINARADNTDDYIVRLIGTKLYIVGANDNALQSAIDYFVDTFVKDDKGKIPANYNFYHKPDHSPYIIAGNNIAEYTIRTERYPSLLIQRAAEAIQQDIIDNCGYTLPIKPMNLDGTDAGNKEIRIGPMNGAVKVDRQYDTRFTSSTWQNYTTIESDNMLMGNGYGYYEIGWDGNSIEITGGSAYAISAGAMKLLADLNKTRTLTTAYTPNGTYTSAYNYKSTNPYQTVDFSLPDGYGLTLAEEFDYTGTDLEKEAGFKTKWNVDNDSTDPTSNMYQVRPGLYGANWWIAADTAGNNYVFEITKKRDAAQGDPSSNGWESVRLSTNKWGFKFGIWETRLVASTRNGACSSVWSVTTAPYSNAQPYLEIDVYENYGRDVFVPCYHSFGPGGTYLANYLYGKPYYQSACWWEANEGEHLYDTFHHVTVDWTYDYIRVYYDGQLGSEMNMTDASEFTPFRNGITIKLANGVGEEWYCQTAPPPNADRVGTAYTPYYWMGLYGGNVNNFFEVQIVDHTRVYQTDNDTIPYKNAENGMKFAASFGR